MAHEKKVGPAAAPALRLEWRDPAELQENGKNWRAHPSAQVDALTDVLAEVGWAGACLYNEATGRLIDGHARRKVAVAQGAAQVPVLVGSWTEEQEATILATLDPLGAMATANAAGLDALLRDVQTASGPIATMLAELHDKNPLPAALPEPGTDRQAAADQAVLLQQKWGTALGQTWQIGRHRVYCGDCLEIEAEKCDGVCTDPPYELKPEIVQAAIGRWAKAAVVLAAGKQAFNLATNGWRHGIDFVWTHQSPRRGPAYSAGHAPLMYHANILVMAQRGHKHGWSRPAPNTSSRFDGDYEDTLGHGHGKPVGLFEFMLIGFPWQTVCDPFAGTLAALLACERLGKTFVGMEIDPASLACGLERCAALSPQMIDS